MAEFDGGNLYEMNKNLMLKYEKEITNKELKNLTIKTIVPYFEEKKNEEYFMLLCNEKKDYTVFRTPVGEKYSNNISNDLLECLINRGKIYSIDRTEDKIALEIWIKYEDTEMCCYYLFPYSQAVIEVKKDNEKSS